MTGGGARKEKPMKLGIFTILCATCKTPQEVEVHSIETSEDLSTKIAYTCLFCKQVQFNEYCPKEKL